MERKYSLADNAEEISSNSFKKPYLRPVLRTIDLMEEEGILYGSDDTYDIECDYAEEDAFSQKKSIWKTEDWLSK